MVSSPVIAVLGVAATVVTFAGIGWDARRRGVARPMLWATVAAAPVAVGFYLYGFVPAAPTTGTIMTANTGLVLYGFEREIAAEGEDSADPRWLPGEPAADGDDESASGSSEE